VVEEELVIVAPFFPYPPSPFQRERQIVDRLLSETFNGPSPSASKPERPRTTTPRRLHKDRRATLTYEQLLDVLFSTDARADIAARNRVSSDLIYRYRRMHQETGKIFGEEI
jgi:hypothetical protein